MQNNFGTNVILFLKIVVIVAKEMVVVANNEVILDFVGIAFCGYSMEYYYHLLAWYRRNKVI